MSTTVTPPISITPSDGSDTLKNKGYVVVITHVPSGKSITFKAFIAAYTETFSPDWVTEVVYGRADPIYQYKNTIRNLTVALKVPAYSAQDAFNNLAKIQLLTQFLYPNYTEVGSATTIAQSPLLRLSVINLARAVSSNNVTPAPTAGADTTTATTSEAPSSTGMTFNTIGEDTTNPGLLGAMKSLTINHNLDGDAGVIEYQNAILPKLIDINFDFGVIHEHHLGWSGPNDEVTFNAPSFPYGLSMVDVPDIT